MIIRLLPIRFPIPFLSRTHVFLHVQDLSSPTPSLYGSHRSSAPPFHRLGNYQRFIVTTVERTLSVKKFTRKARNVILLPSLRGEGKKGSIYPIVVAFSTIWKFFFFFFLVSGSLDQTALVCSTKIKNEKNY